MYFSMYMPIYNLLITVTMLNDGAVTSTSGQA